MTKGLPVAAVRMLVLVCIAGARLTSQNVAPTSRSFGEMIQAKTIVHPLSGEDIASDCHYMLTIPNPHNSVRGVWVIFDRGHDIHDLYDDPDVLDFARRFDLGLLLHSHCPGKNAADHDDMNMDPRMGLGPALSRSLDQLAQTTGHAELSKTGLILLGFSGAGPLSARLIGEYPDRVVAGILSSPGHFSPDGIDTVELSTRAQGVPELIIAGGADDVSGTELPIQYFKKYRHLGAPWAFTVQNRSPHCCTANAKALILAWLGAVVEQRLPKVSGTALNSIRQGHGWLSFIETQKTAVKDSFGLETFNVSAAQVKQESTIAPAERLTGGWLPNKITASEWLSFVKQDRHPILPLH